MAYQPLPAVPCGRSALLIDPPSKALHQQIATTAVSHPVHILDFGNSFNVWDITRTIRRLTVDVDTVLSQLTIQRAFTCYEAVTALQTTVSIPDSRLVILRMCALFTDENLTTTESARLLHLCLDEISRIQYEASVLITSRTPAPDNRAFLLDHLIERTPIIWRYKPDDIQVSQPPLLAI